MLVEMAIVVPIFLLIVWCVIDFSRAYSTFNTLATAVREGARFAAVQKDPCLAATVAAIKTKVKGAGPTGADSIADIKITVTPCPTVDRVTVSVTGYVWRITTPITFIPGGQITMNKAATFRWERQAN
ncbi:MAG TPA: TadE/TadG family type IV pilus assembly protein [Anaerolineales bacterium]